MTFLAIDVGNTRLKWALYQQPRPGAALIAQGAEFLEHIERLAEGPWAELPSPQRMLLGQGKLRMISGTMSAKASGVARPGLTRSAT